MVFVNLNYYVNYQYGPSQLLNSVVPVHNKQRKALIVYDCLFFIIGKNYDCHSGCYNLNIVKGFFSQLSAVAALGLRIWGGI